MSVVARIRYGCLGNQKTPARPARVESQSRNSRVYGVTTAPRWSIIAVISMCSFSTMQLIALVNCSARKTAPIDPDLRASALAKSSLWQVASDWHARVARAAGRVRADSLYNGRAFDIARKVAQTTGEDFYVLSAGMGFVKCDAKIPPYSLSVSPDGRDSVLCRASSRSRFSAREWWHAVHLTQGRTNPIGALLRRKPDALIVIAATGPYLDMIGDEINDLPDCLCSRVRIVGLKSPNLMDARLRPLVMPYDARLNDVSLALRGTEFDYPARALVHFSNLLRQDNVIEPVEEHARRVRLSLSHHSAPRRIVRQRIDENSLRRAIETFKRDGISRSRALDTLRNVMGLACEQQRFSDAWTFE